MPWAHPRGCRVLEFAIPTQVGIISTSSSDITPSHDQTCLKKEEWFLLLLEAFIRIPLFSIFETHVLVVQNHLFVNEAPVSWTFDQSNCALFEPATLCINTKRWSFGFCLSTAVEPCPQAAMAPLDRLSLYSSLHGPYIMCKTLVKCDQLSSVSKKGRENFNLYGCLCVCCSL